MLQARSHDLTSLIDSHECGVFMLKAIHHVAIICSDYERSKQFYTQILRLPVIREIWRAERQSWKCDLQIGSAQIELFSFPDPPPRPSRPEARGLRHLAFQVQSLEPIIARVEEFGIIVEPIRIDEHTQQRFTFFADPDGLPLELYEDNSEGLRASQCCTTDTTATLGCTASPARISGIPTV